MKRLAGAVCLFGLLFGAPVLAQSAPSADEGRAHTWIAGNQLRFRLPLTAAAVHGVRVSAWLLSPEGTRSQSVSADVGAGLRVAEVALPVPRDKNGKMASDFSWYRIGYQLDSADGSSQGVVAVGAVAANLLELRLATPEPVMPGETLAVRVYATNPVTRRRVRGVSLRGTLSYDDPASKRAKPPQITVERVATTGAGGEALLSFPMPNVPGLEPTVTVKGTLQDTEGNRSTATVDKDLEVDDHAGIEIEMDKPLHKPGEVVHLRALAVDGHGRPIDKAKLTTTIEDPDSKKLVEEPVVTNRFGIATYDWKTDAHIATGDYTADFSPDDSSDYQGSGRIQVSISRYDLPEFAVTASMDKGYYLDGETPVVHLHAAYLFGKSVAGGTVRIARVEQGEWNPKIRRYEKPQSQEQTAALNASGDADVRLDVKDKFAVLNSEDYRRFEDMEYRATVTDASTGRSEPHNFTVRLTRYPVHIYLNQVAANQYEGDFLVTTSYADGLPAACRISLDWMDKDGAHHAASANTNVYGVAKVRLHFPPGIKTESQASYGIRLTARDAEGRISRSDETVYQGEADAVWIEVAHSLLKPNQPIEAVIHASRGTTVDLDVVAEAGLLDHERIRMDSDEEPVTIPANGAFHGLVALWAYDFDFGGESSYGCYRCGSMYKNVLYPEDRELNIKVSGVQASYTPGADVNGTLALRSADKGGTAGIFGISVFDEAVEQRAMTEEDANQRWFGPYWWGRGESVGGVSLASLNKTNLNQPIPDDLDLAAEAVLQYVGSARVSIEAEDYSDEIAKYTTLMKDALTPLGKALLDANPQKLPTAPEAVLAAAGPQISTDAMLDPWHTPYRFRDTIVWNDEILEAESAGPDKRFGTVDDFTVEVTRRNLFAVPGNQLSEILRAAAANENLPAGVDALKELSHAKGLDLDAAVDPDGKPYRYEVTVSGRSYFVRVFRSVSQVGGEYQWPLWISPYVDYFGPEQSRIEAALDAWARAGHDFPDTQEQALAALNAAGIDVGRLRDPLGNRLSVSVARVLRFVQLEKVVGGSGSLQSSVTPVTRTMRAVLVTRNQDALEGVAQTVAEFLHPVAEQSGDNAVPVPVDDGTFKSNTGAIGGTIVDPTGAVIPNAAVIIKSADGTTEIARAKSGENGIYLVRDLAAGIYTVSFESPGFMSAAYNQIRVSAYALTTVDVKLNVGAANETVTVTSDAPSLSTTSASLAASTKAQGTQRARATVTEPDQLFTPRLRHLFEETAYWAPALETDGVGRTNLHFRLPDSLTTWKLRATASTLDGRVVTTDQTFRTFQPFFVDLDAPQVLTAGDELQLPVTLRNYTQHDVSLPLSAGKSDWFTLTNAPTEPVHVAANGSRSPAIGLRAEKATDAGPLRITAANSHEGDAVEKTVRVHPDGEPQAVAMGSLLRGKQSSVSLELPANVISGSEHVTVLVYPNLGAQILHSMKAVLERPYGCGEQTISSTYPSLLYLELLRAAGDNATEANAEAKAEAVDYLQLGTTRLMDYFDASGGLTYWGGGRYDAPDAALTAYGVEFLTDASSYTDVDRQSVARALHWLVDHQDADGTWNPRYGSATADETLYIAATMNDALRNGMVPDDLRTPLEKAVDRAAAWAGSSVEAVHDPYANALRLKLAKGEAGALQAELQSTATRDRNGTHWAQGTSPFYSWGRAGTIETTAEVLSALEENHGTSRSTLIDDALLYLLENKDRYGIWFNGQATVRVLQALLPIAAEQMKAAAPAQDIGLTINGVQLTGSAALHPDPQLAWSPRSVDISRFLRPGHNQLTFSGSDESQLGSADILGEVYVPWLDQAQKHVTQTSKDAGLDFSYHCESTSNQVGTPFDCSISVRRFGSQGFGMLLAEVGLPPGADVNRPSLAKLIDGGEISRYELQPDRIIFYVWSSKADGTQFSFQFTPRYGIRAKSAPSALWDYYNPDLRAVLPPQSYVIIANSAQLN